MPRKKSKLTKKVGKKKTSKIVSKGQDALSLALYLIAFVLVIFGAWYHQISWILFGFVPFFVALWYNYMKKHNL